MLVYDRKLQNPFYFFTSNVLFKISKEQDADNCGLHKVTFEPLYDDNNEVITKDVKVGEYYTDEHGTSQKSDSDKTVTVYSVNLNHTECQKVFPYFSVNYTYNNGTEDEPEIKNYTVHYYLQSMIEVGDLWDNNKFKRNNKHTGTDDVDYLLEFKNSIKEDIKSFIKSGSKIDEIENIMPHWCFESNKDKNFTVDGKKMTFKSTSSNFIPFKENELKTIYFETIEELVKEYANDLLKPMDYIVNDTEENKAIQINEDTTSVIL